MLTAGFLFMWKFKCRSGRNLVQTPRMWRPLQAHAAMSVSVASHWRAGVRGMTTPPPHHPPPPRGCLSRSRSSPTSPRRMEPSWTVRRIQSQGPWVMRGAPCVNRQRAGHQRVSLCGMSCTAGAGTHLTHGLQVNLINKVKNWDVLRY